MRRILCVLLLLSVSVNAQAGDFKRLMLMTPFYWGAGGAVALTTFAVDGTTDSVEFIFQMPEAATLTKCGLRMGAHTGTPPTYRASLQGVDGAGIPDGTIKSSGNAFVTFTPPADSTWDNTWQWFTFGSSYSSSRGEMLSFVFDWSSGAVDASNRSFVTSVIASVTTAQGFPYVITRNAGSRSRVADMPVFACASASKTFGYPILSTAVTSYSSNSTPDEYGVAWSLDTAWGSTYKVGGICLFHTSAAAAKTVVMTLYDGTTALQNVTLDSDQMRAAATASLNSCFYFDETTLSTLSFNHTYRIAFAPQETSANFAITMVTAPSAGDMVAFAGGGNFYKSTRTDSGSWTDDTASAPMTALVIDDWTGGGGTTIVAPGPVSY